MTAPTDEIPIVDFAPWHATNASAEQRQVVGTALASATRSHGFVQIVGHGVPEALVHEAFAVSRRLFNLDDATKKLAPHPPGFAVHRGYSWPGLEKVSHLGDGDNVDVEKERRVADCKESYEVGSEGNADQPNVWLPESALPGFRDFSTAFYWTCHAVSLELIKALALGLGLSTSEPLLRHHSGHGNQLRLLHYPPVQEVLVRRREISRMPAHTDWGTITLLFQDAAGGLQVERPDAPDDFIDIIPADGAICVNIGDVLMRWSNDYLKSTLHRVGLPPSPTAYFEREEDGQRMTHSRYSIVYFVSPDLDFTIDCLPSCVSAERPAKYSPILWKEYMLMRASTQYQ